MQFIPEILEHPSLLAYFSGADNYTWLQFRNGERRLLAKPLVYFEKRLPSFVRIHKTVLINPDCIVAVHQPPHAKTTGSVEMDDGALLPISRRRWREIASFLQDYLRHGGGNTPPLVRTPYTAPLRRILAVMNGDAFLLTHDCIQELGFPCSLESVSLGADLGVVLSQEPKTEWPSIIFLDARTQRADRVSALKSLKSHSELRSIPVVWLMSPTQDSMQAYELNANSVVEVPDNPAAFVHIISHLCRYWLIVVQLPPGRN